MILRSIPVEDKLLIAVEECLKIDIKTLQINTYSISTVSVLIYQEEARPVYVSKLGDYKGNLYDIDQSGEGRDNGERERGVRRKEIIIRMI